MKRLLILLLLCALALTGCTRTKPTDHMLDGDGMEKPAPEAPPVIDSAEAPPTDGEIEAMRPRLILDGSEPGEADGITLRILDYQPGELTVEYLNASGNTWMYVPSFALGIQDGGQWITLPWPEDAGQDECEYDLADGERTKLVLDLTPLGDLDAGEYRLTANGIEAAFRLVYTE